MNTLGRKVNQVIELASSRHAQLKARGGNRQPMQWPMATHISIVGATNQPLSPISLVRISA